MGNGRVSCKWKGDWLKIKKGEIEDFKGMESLKC